MRKTFLQILICFGIVCTSKAQTTNLTHSGISGDWVGWYNSSFMSLDIANESSIHPINFYTNVGMPAFGSLANLRLFIEPQGNIGIGGFTPANAMLHLHQTNDTRVNFQMTDGSTGQSVYDGFEIQYHDSGYFHMVQNEYMPFDIFSAGTNGYNYLRLRIWGSDTNNIQQSRIGIPSYAWLPDTFLHKTMPVAMLHIGDPVVYRNDRFGFRTWMEYGTYIQGGDDNVYFGLKNEDPTYDHFTDFGDAVVSWGDNLLDPPGTMDNINDLRFIFTASPGSAPGIDTTAYSYDGLEMARISANGNMGIGNFFDYGAGVNRPARRLEVLDNGRNEPQLRLTYNQAGFSSPTAVYTDFMSTVNGDLLISPRYSIFNTRRRVGINMDTSSVPQAALEVRRATVLAPHLRLSNNDTIYSDFQTTTAGNLFINPVYNGTNKNVGINTNAPNATLEINSNAASASGTGSSGLQFTDLNLTSSGYGANPSRKVLSVDSLGNVILVNDSVGSGSGSLSICPGGTPTSDYLMRFSGSTSAACSSMVYQNVSSNRIGIGNTNPVGKLGVLNTDNTTNCVAGEFVSYTPVQYALVKAVDALVAGQDATQDIIAGYFNAWGTAQSSYGIQANASSTSSNNYGVAASAVTSISGNNHGLTGTARNATNNYAAYCLASYGDMSVGVYSAANGGSVQNFGVKTLANGSGSANYGIYAQASGGTTNYGIYAVAPTSGTIDSTNTAAYFNGNIYSSGAFNPSDIKLKQNIKPLANATNLLSQLNTKTYEFKLSSYPGMNLPSGLQYGFVAQDVEQVIPGMVRKFINPAELDSSGNVRYPEVDFKALNYEVLIPILVAAFQEQNHELDSIKTVLANFIGQPKSSNSNGVSNPQQRITLSNQQGIILQQNDPNPFAESTIIRFVIPKEVTNARIMFTDMKGTVLKSAVIESRGEGSLEVFASDLSSGLYTYTLVCDGKVIDSKKMVKN